MPIEEALVSDCVVETTRVILKAVLDTNKGSLKKSGFVNAKFDSSTWQLFL